MLIKLVYSTIFIAIVFPPWMSCTATKPYKHVGCFRDSRNNRAFPQHFWNSPLPNNTEVETCAAWASNVGSKVFAVQYTYECWVSHTADRKYLRYGPATNCRLDGKGGDLANDVYQFTDEVLWPRGTYSILKPSSGCPSLMIDNGWLLQYSVDAITNDRSSVLSIDGYVTRGYVVRSFCTKTIGSVGGDWPTGQYCMYKEGNMTPPKLTSGSIKMDNDYAHNMAVMSMKYNHGITINGSSIRISYFCQANGVKSVPIDLPISQPFYLLPYGSPECQQVKWMVATKEWIRYGTRNYQTPKSWRIGTTPYTEAGERTGLKVFYCFYTSCNQTVNNTQGVFQSPYYPEKYADGQLCSWRILVPVNHTVLVHFKQFSLDESSRNDADFLELHRLTNKSFVLSEVYKGYREPFKVSSASDLLFVFRSNEANSSQGFRAQYELYVPEKSSSSEKPASKTRPIQKTELPLTHHEPSITTRSTTTSFETKQGALKDNSEGTGTAILIVIPLVCFIVIVVVGIDIYCRWKLNHHTKANRPIANNPTYGRPGDDIKMALYEEAVTSNTTDGHDDPDKSYDKLRHLQPKHKIPAHYDQLNTSFCPSNDNGSTIREKGTEHMYNVLESPTSSGPLSSNEMYHTIDTGTSTRNVLYESAYMQCS